MLLNVTKYILISLALSVIFLLGHFHLCDSEFENMYATISCRNDVNKHGIFLTIMYIAYHTISTKLRYKTFSKQKFKNIKYIIILIAFYIYDVHP